MGTVSSIVLYSALGAAALGVLLPYWPLSLAGVLIAAFGGQWILATVLGLLLDIFYGRPPAGWLHAVSFPFAALAVFVSLLRVFVTRYLRKSETEFL